MLWPRLHPGNWGLRISGMHAPQNKPISRFVHVYLLVFAMPAKYPKILAATVLRLVHDEGWTPSKVEHTLKLSRTYVTDVLRRWDEDGSLDADGKQGRKHTGRKMDALTRTVLRKLVEENDARTQSEFAAALTAITGKPFSQVDICRAFKDMGITVKTRTQHNLAASLQAQIDYQHYVYSLGTWEQFMFSDEAGVSRRDGIRRRDHSALPCLHCLL